MSDPHSKFMLTSQQEDDGSTRLDIMLDTRSLSHLWVFPMTYAIGVARVRVDGIGGVSTEEEWRNQGHARRLIETSIQRMQNNISDPAQLSLLWGVPNLYEKFGYISVAPESYLYLTELTHPVPMPSGWRMRSCEPRDIPAIHALYEQNTARAIGATIRQTEGRVWKQLAEITRAPDRDECRVIEAPDGSVAGYAWRGRDFWPVNTEEESPELFAIGEAMSCDIIAADALLAACRAWAVEEKTRRPAITRVELSVPVDGPIYAAAMRQHARLEVTWEPSGGCMARTLDVEGLLRALAPELTGRLQGTRISTYGRMRLITDLGAAVLDLSPSGVTVLDSAGAANNHDARETTIELPQQMLAQMAFGTFAPDVHLDRLKTPIDDIAHEWIEVLFPQRNPYVHLPDWV